MSALANIIMTGTAVAPVVLVYALMAFFDDECLAAIILIIVFILLVVSFVGLLTYAKRELERQRVTFTQVESVDRESMAIMLVYLVPLFRSSFTDLEWTILLPAGLIFIALVLTSHNHHFNPLLNLLGWHFYKVNTQEKVAFILITKRRIHRADHPIEVRQLTNYTFIDIGGN